MVNEPMTTDSTPGDPAEPPALAALAAGTQHVRAGNILGGVGLAALMLSLPVTWFAQVALGDRVGSLGGMLALLSPLMLLAGWTLRSAVPKGRATVHVADGAIAISREGAEQRIPVNELTHGVVVPMADRARLELQRKNGSVLAVDVVPGETGALERLLAQIGIGPDKRRLRTRIGGWTSPVFRAFFCAIGLMATLIPLLIVFAPHWGDSWGIASERLLRTAILGGIAVASWVIADLSLGPEVVVGTDGISLKRAALRRFIPHAAIASVSARDGAARLTLRDDTDISLGSTADGAHALALVEHIKRAARTTGSPDTAARAEALDRRGRPLAEWRTELQRILKTAGDYRAAVLDRADLTAVLEDPDAPAERRIGAALALGPADDGAAAERIRVAAGACADERVRVALEDVAAGKPSDDTIETALATTRRTA